MFNRFGYLGLGSRPVIRPPAAAAFDLTAGPLSSDFVYTRNDTVATYRDSDGVWQKAAANAARFDHDENGVPLGILFEPARVNKCSVENANPVNLTGITITTTGTGTGQLVDDSAQLEAAGLGDLVSGGMVLHLDNSGDPSNSLNLAIDGNAGNTNAHSWSFYYRSVGSNRVARLRPNAASIDVNHSETYTRFTYENDNPDGNTRKFTLICDAGEEIYVILWQMEEGAYCTTPIAGAGGSRAVDRMYLADVDQKEYFDETQGFISLKYSPRFDDTEQYLVVANNNASSQTIGIRHSVSGDQLVRGYVRASSSSKHSSTAEDRPAVGERNATFIAWRPGESILWANGGFNRQTYTGDAAGITRIDVACRNGGASPMYGHVSGLSVGKEFDLLAAGRACLYGDEQRFIGAGQSLIQHQFQTPDSGDPLGKEYFTAAIDGVLTGRALYANGAASGSALLKVSAGDSNYWYDDDAGVWDGDGAVQFIRAARTLGRSARAINWDQGEGDMGAVNSGTVTIERLREGLLATFAWLRSWVGEVPVVITPLGRRSEEFTENYHVGWQNYREMQQQLAADYDWIHLAPERFDLGLLDETGVSDSVHLSDAGYQTLGARQARKILSVVGEAVSAVDGPEIVSVERSGTSVTVTIEHASGTDFTPSTGIEGFVFLDDGEEIAITAAARTDATTITLTLDSAPTGIETLYYGYQVMYGVDPDNLVRDNSANTLPLRAAKQVLAPPPPPEAFDLDYVAYDGKWFSTYNSVPGTLPDATINPYDYTFKPDGTKMYTTHRNFSSGTNYIVEFSLSTPWDVSTAVYAGYGDIDIGLGGSGPTSHWFKSDGTAVYCLISSTIYQYDLTVAWDITSIEYNTISASTDNVAEPIFSPAGDFMLARAGTSFSSYDVSPAWDIDGISSTGDTFNVNPPSGASVTGSYLSPDGLRLYVVSNTNDAVYQFNLSVAWDLTTAASTGKTIDIGSLFGLSSPRGVAWSPDGEHLYVSGNGIIVQLDAA